ncbi:MAG: beta-propeller domain-containing protein [Clostridia bacterium]|nr:beta-propeller domain-containing protein [Clostridia bacterium]
MKKKNWYRGLSLADDKYITEAHPDNVIKSKNHRALISFVAACACLALIIGNLWLFVPFNNTAPDVSQYSNSEYYGLIQKLNALTFEQPKYKNNSEKLWAGLKNISLNLGGWVKDEAAGEAPIPESNPNEGFLGGEDSYQEITDNQVKGIIEADRIKRSNTHIYYLDEDVLRIYSIDKENTAEIGNYTIYEEGKGPYMDQWEFYLSSDCKTVTVVTQYYSKNENVSRRYVNLISLDVSDPANIVKEDEFNITGEYMSSRMVDGSILLLTEFVINKRELDFNDETTFLPQIDEGNGSYSIPAGGIVSPDNLSNTRYTVVMKLDENTLDIQGTAAYLSYSEDVYVSEDHVFLTHVFADKKENEDGTITRNSMTEISCLTYGGDTFERKGNVTVRGYVKDQWSMDEYEGILRVFTTTNATTIQEQYYDNGIISSNILQTATGQSNASLYCIDLSTFEIVASVIDFAPPREEIQSVRFDKETAYVCTSIELSDPVFFFDLSDLNNITYKDTGTIEGFSTSLINIGNGYLLGIGRGDNWSSFKIEVYEEAKDGVRSVCAYELENAEYSTEYKSYYVDRKNQFVGVGVIDNSYYNTDKHSDEARRYILLHFDGYELVELVNVPLFGDPANMRGVYIDGYMYMFGSNDFKVEKITN